MALEEQEDIHMQHQNTPNTQNTQNTASKATLILYHKPTIILFISIGACELGTYEINTTQKSLYDICGNMIDDDLNGKIDDGCDCSVLNEQVEFYPSIPGLSAPNLNKTSKCEKGISICVQDPKTNKYIQKQIKKPILPDDKETACNGIDDNCDGNVDEDSRLMQSCYSTVTEMGMMEEICRRNGTYVCDYKKMAIVCSVTNRPAADPKYYFSSPYVIKPATASDLTPILEWDWNCDNPSKIDTGFVNSTSISPTNYNTTESSIIATASINQIQASAITSTPATLCSMNKLTWYDSTGADKYNIVRSGTLPPSSTECGKSFIAVKCTGTTTISGSFEIVTVVCK
jgi:hypothetical protein